MLRISKGETAGRDEDAEAATRKEQGERSPLSSTLEDQPEMEKREELVFAGIQRFLDELMLAPLPRQALLQWIQKIVCSEEKRETCRRVRGWLLNEVNKRRIPLEANSWQIGCPELIPGLRACPFWDRKEFSWVQIVEEAFESIRVELLSLKTADQRTFQPYRGPARGAGAKASDGVGSLGHDAGHWNVFYLFLHNVDCASNRALCPETVHTLSSLPNAYEHAFFSALAPNTHITKHHGPTNKKLRCHLPLVVPSGGCEIRVGGERRLLEEGKCLIFDDSFEHEVWNHDLERSRIVLIFDVWHPDLNKEECRFFHLLQKAREKADRRYCEENPSGEDFYAVIERAKNLPVEESAIWSF